MDCMFKDDIVKYLLEADIIIEEIEKEKNNYKFIAISVIILTCFIIFVYIKRRKIKNEN